MLQVSQSLRFTTFLHLGIQDDVSIFVFDPEPPGGVAGFLPPICVDGLHCAIWILSPLVLCCVDLLLACVKKDLFGAVPERNRMYTCPVSLQWW